MKLPTQAQPVVRKISTVTIIGGGVVLSQDCEVECRDKCLKTLGPLGCTFEACEEAIANCMTNCKRIKCP